MQLYIDLGLVSSNTMVGSEDSVAFRVTSAQTKADTNPDREASSLEEQDRCQDATAKTQAGFDQSVGQDEVPLKKVSFHECNNINVSETYLIVQQVLGSGRNFFQLFRHFVYAAECLLVCGLACDCPKRSSSGGSGVYGCRKKSPRRSRAQF